MTSAIDIRRIMAGLAAEHLSEDWDNVGLIIGRADRQVERILISLDYTEKTRLEAVEKGCQMVITHHPPIFSKLNKINDQTPVGRLILGTIASDISIYSAHTNLDYADGGTSDALFEILGLSEKDTLMMPNIHGKSLGRVGSFSRDYSLEQVCALVKEKLGVSTLKCVGNPEAVVKKAAIMPGSGATGEFFASALAKDVDVYITGDLKYHDALDAAALGLNVIDATHFATENIVCEYIKKHLEKNLEENKSAEIILSEASEPPFNFM